MQTFMPLATYDFAEPYDTESCGTTGEYDIMELK